MININPVIEKLSLGLEGIAVTESTSLAANPESQSNLPAIYVHASQNKPNGTGLISQHFAVQIVEKNQKLPELWQKVNNILMQSQLEGRPIEYEQGKIVDIYQEITWWVDVYSLSVRHQGQCG